MWLMSMQADTRVQSRRASNRVANVAVATARTVSDGVVVVVPSADAEAEGAVAGGATRSESVRAGRRAVARDAGIICVHDAARPLASPALFEAVVEAVRAGADGAVPAIPVTDTIKVVDAAGRVVATPDAVLVTAADIAHFAGVGFWHAVERELGRRVVLDCADDAGLVMAALRQGLRDILFTGRADVALRLAGMAATSGARLRRSLDPA